MDELLHRKSKPVLPAHNSSKELANRLCSFFVNKIDEIRTKLDSTSQDTTPAEQSELATETLANFTPATEQEVSKIIRASPTKSCSLDPLPTWMLKNMDLVPTITNIINGSLTSGVFPSSFKSALVRPLIKKPTLDPDILRNYRPVSNLAFISKVLEKVVSAQLTSHMRTHGLYEKHQSAYRCYHSTETALVKVQNDLLRAVDSGGGVFLVLIYLSAAFDTLDHNILLRRLEESVGLSGVALQWMDSYLRGRSQSVVIDGVKSEPADLQYGVPQGVSYWPSNVHNILQSHRRDCKTPQPGNTPLRR